MTLKIYFKAANLNFKTALTKKYLYTADYGNLSDGRKFHKGNSTNRNKSRKFIF